MDKIRIRDKHPGSATLRRTMNRVADPDGSALFWKAGSGYALVTIQEIKWLKMDSRRAVVAHNGGLEAQKWSLEHHFDKERDPDPH